MTKLEVLQKTIVSKEQSLQALREASSGRASETFFAKEKEWREKGYRLTGMKDRLERSESAFGAGRGARRRPDGARSRDELSMRRRELKYDGTSVEREKLEREIARLKVEVEHIGTIDPLVVEEYQETEKRFEFFDA